MDMAPPIQRGAAGPPEFTWFVDWGTTWKIRRHGRCSPWLTADLEADPDYVKLNLGCGSLVFSPERGWINMDMNEGPGIVVHNLYDAPWPFLDDTFDYLFMSNILEHVCQSRWFDVIGELFRVSKPGAIWEIQGPDPENVVITLQAPSHVSLIGPWTWFGFVHRQDLGDLNIADQSSRFRLEPVDCVYDRNRPRRWTRYYGVHVGPLTDYHLRKYLGRRLGEAVARVIGKPWNLRLVYRVRK